MWSIFIYLFDLMKIVQFVRLRAHTAGVSGFQLVLYGSNTQLPSPFLSLLSSSFFFPIKFQKQKKGRSSCIFFRRREQINNFKKMLTGLLRK